MPHNLSRTALVTGLALLAPFAMHAQDSQQLLEAYTPVTYEEIENPDPSEWLMWRRTQNHWGYSPLDQINKESVGDLRLAWAWTMEPGMQETTPLVRDGIMFLPQACDFIEAV